MPQAHAGPILQTPPKRVIELQNARIIELEAQKAQMFTQMNGRILELEQQNAGLRKQNAELHKQIHAKVTGEFGIYTRKMINKELAAKDQEMALLRRTIAMQSVRPVDFGFNIILINFDRVMLRLPTRRCTGSGRSLASCRSDWRRPDTAWIFWNEPNLWK